MKFGPPICCGVSRQAQVVYGARLRPSHALRSPASRLTRATISPSGMNRTVVSFGRPGTAKVVIRSNVRPSVDETSVAVHSVDAPGSALYVTP
jgi:hypothetical protein